jgi:hypothetical protein
MSISKTLLAFTLALLVVSCKSDPLGVTSPRSRLGEMKVAVTASYRNTDGVLEMEFRGRAVSPMEPRDSLYTVAGKGAFKRRIVLRDTFSTRRDSISIYYSFPAGIAVRIDTFMTFVCHYKQTASGFGLILKTKADSLVCLAGNLTGAELESFQPQTGVQNFRVRVGPDAYVTRNTACGREGDYNTFFSVKTGFVSAPPAKGNILKDGALTYSVFNIANTQIVKNIKDCADYAGELGFIAVRQ